MVDKQLLPGTDYSFGRLAPVIKNLYQNKLKAGFYDKFPNAKKLVGQVLDSKNKTNPCNNDEHYSNLSRKQQFDIWDNPPKGHYLISTEEQLKMFRVVGCIAKEFTLENGDFLGLIQSGECKWSNLSEEIRKNVDKKRYEQYGTILEKDFDVIFTLLGLKASGVCYANRLSYAGLFRTDYLADEVAFIIPYLDKLAELGIETIESTILNYFYSEIQTPFIIGNFSKKVCQLMRKMMPYAKISDKQEYWINISTQKEYLQFAIKGEDPFFDDLLKICQVGLKHSNCEL